jgi:hypothetical protein
MFKLFNEIYILSKLHYSPTASYKLYTVKIGIVKRIVAACCRITSRTNSAALLECQKRSAHASGFSGGYIEYLVL